MNQFLEFLLKENPGTDVTFPKNCFLLEYGRLLIFGPARFVLFKSLIEGQPIRGYYADPSMLGKQAGMLPQG